MGEIRVARGEKSREIRSEIRRREGGRKGKGRKEKKKHKRHNKPTHHPSCPSLPPSLPSFLPCSPPTYNSPTPSPGPPPPSSPHSGARTTSLVPLLLLLLAGSRLPLTSNDSIPAPMSLPPHPTTPSVCNKASRLLTPLRVLTILLGPRRARLRLAPDLRNEGGEGGRRMIKKR